MILVSTPVAVCYSIKAVRVAPQRAASVTALVVSILESVLLTLLLVSMGAG